MMCTVEICVHAPPMLRQLLATHQLLAALPLTVCLALLQVAWHELLMHYMCKDCIGALLTAHSAGIVI